MEFFQVTGMWAVVAYVEAGEIRVRLSKKPIFCRVNVHSFPPMITYYYPDLFTGALVECMNDVEFMQFACKNSPMIPEWKARILKNCKERVDKFRRTHGNEVTEQAK